MLRKCNKFVIGHIEVYDIRLLHSHPPCSRTPLTAPHRILFADKDRLDGTLWGGGSQFSFIMYKHLKSVVLIVVGPLRVGNSAQVVFCRVVLLFDALCQRASSVFFKWVFLSPFIVWRTPPSARSTVPRPCRWTGPGSAGTAAPTGPDSRSRPGFATPPRWLRRRAADAARQKSSVNDLGSLCFASTRSCVRCGLDT